MAAKASSSGIIAKKLTRAGRPPSLSENRTLVFIPETNPLAISKIRDVVTDEVPRLRPLFTAFKKYYPQNVITDNRAYFFRAANPNQHHHNHWCSASITGCLYEQGGLFTA
jgi:hypothetical protein